MHVYCSKNGLALWYVVANTSELCLVAVQQDGLSLQYVADETPEICLDTIQNNV